MKLEMPDEHIPLLIRALEHYYAYTRAVQRDDSRYQQIADSFKRKPPLASKLDPKSLKRKRV